MHFSIIFRVLGILLIFFSFTMIPPIIINWVYDDKNSFPFVVTALSSLISGAIMTIFTIKYKRELAIKDGFIVVILVWLIMGIYGAIPYFFSKGLDLTFSSAVFESISGFTTTGATIISNLNVLPKSILYYRQQSQLLGGMGIVILSVAILPMLGVGGMQLYRAEATSGPWKDNKLTPHIADTAKALWSIYMFLVIFCFLSYLCVGMNWFDAICYSFSTIGTGGFSPKDSGMIEESSIIQFVCMLFMLISATSFALHFKVIQKRSIKLYLTDPEFRSYIFFAFSISVIVILTLISQNVFSSNKIAFQKGLFQVISFVSNTGFVSSNDYHKWPLFLPVLLMIVGLIGGCAGSSSGGLKIVRAVLIKKQALIEAKKLVHPTGVFPIKFGKHVMNDKVMSGVWGFVSAYFMIFVVLWLLMLSVGVSSMTAFSAVAASISNLGPGLGDVGVNYTSLPTKAHWILNFAMLVGRLEVFTILVLFVPDFWRR